MDLALPPGGPYLGGAIGQVLPYLGTILKAWPQEPSPSPSLSRGNFLPYLRAIVLPYLGAILKA